METLTSPGSEAHTLNGPDRTGPPLLPSVFIPHGGGPCFFMDWTMGPPDTWDRLAEFLRSFADRIAVKPDAIVVVSGHHEGDVVESATAPAPPLLFDYWFPPHTYELRCPAPGSPALGRRIGEMLAEARISHRFEDQRGFETWQSCNQARLPDGIPAGSPMSAA